MPKVAMFNARIEAADPSGAFKDAWKSKHTGEFYSADDFTAVGWTLGAGADWAVTDNWIVRGEYRFTQFSGKDFTTQPEDEDYELDDLNTHDIRIGIAYKF